MALATSSVSLSDILTATKNVVTAINGVATTALSIYGNQNKAGITAATVVKIGAGRLVNISVIVAGSADGAIYDSGALGVTVAPLCVVPQTLGVTSVNLAVSNGILVVPGSGQTVTVGFS